MVKLIPDVLSPDIKSDAEKKLFIEFRDYITDEQCVVLHSLGVAEHSHNVFGEIDFVIISRQGVLCLEIKGGSVFRENGIWGFTNRYGKVTKKNEGPFQQVQGNMQSLRQYMIKRLGSNDPLVTCQYACAVIMPDCVFNDEEGIDVIPEILFDASSEWNLGSIVSQSFKFWRNLCLNKHGFQGGFLSDRDIEEMSYLLRGDFQFVPSMKSLIDRADKELCALTAEQYEILESLSDNPRTIVTGVAGTGKTLLAMEQVRRACWEGKRALYLCFNHNIAKYVEYQLGKESVEADVLTLHALMLRTCSLEWSANRTSSFYTVELPQLFLASVHKPIYDLVVVDEGQDLLTPSFMPCIESLIQDGIKSGNWAIYLDPNQNIFNSSQELDPVLNMLRPLATNWRLTVNCRNTKQISDANTLMTNVNYQGRTKVSGPQVQILPYESKRQEAERLNEILCSLRSDGVIGSDLVILSPYVLNNRKNVLSEYGISKEAGTLKDHGNLWQAKKNEIRFSTVAAYKGLESKIIILLDIEHFADDNYRLLNYVAVSRACSMLYVLYDKSAEDERQDMLLRGFKKIIS